MNKLRSFLLDKLEQRFSHLRIFLERRKQDIRRPGAIPWYEPYERRERYWEYNNPVKPQIHHPKIHPITGEEE